MISDISLNETAASANHGQTISRAAAVLRVLARGAGGWRLTDIAAETKLTKPTALRLLRALEGEGFAFCDLGGQWRLGLGLVTLGAAAANRDGIRHLAGEALHRLADRTGDTIFFSLREGAEIVCVDRREGSFPIRTLMLNPGDRRPLGIGAAGMAVLAYLPDDERNAALAEIEPMLPVWPGHTVELISQRIALARLRGHALNDGQIFSAMWAVGVPICDGAGRVVAALSLAAITERMQEPRLAELVALLRTEAEAIEMSFRIDPGARSPTPRVGPPVGFRTARGGRTRQGGSA